MSSRKAVVRLFFLGIALWGCVSFARAQQFYNLTADEVRIDSVLPRFSCSLPLPRQYADSAYQVRIAYPEFIEMTPADIASYLALTRDTLPEMPEVHTQVVVSRKEGSLEASFVPLAYRDGKYCMLVSFMLQVEARPLGRRALQVAGATSPAERYAASSVLAEGRWVKIRVPSTGIYELSDALLRKAGFSNKSRVKVYGYGGALLSEQLNGTDLMATDDLKEVPVCNVDGHLLFRAQGTVHWKTDDSMRRVRNHYSDYGYYFLTENDAERNEVDSAAFMQYYPAPSDYHTLHEVDNFSWLHSGRNFYENNPVAAGASRTYVMNRPGASDTGRLAVSVTAGTNTKVSVELNDSLLGQMSISPGGNDKGGQYTAIYDVTNLRASDTVKVNVLSGGPARLDYIDLYTPVPRPAPNLRAGNFAAPEYVYQITNQNLHAHTAADMVIIIPTSQKTRSQAERLAAYHEQADSLRVRIVPADELFNEFSSGTPDASAYRNYMKMLYDRADNEADMPKYLLLFGDGFWDNRMLTSDCTGYSPDDFLLCMESENSFSATTSYVDDGYYGYLDDGEGVDPLTRDKLDIGIGRISCRTLDEAKTVVDKTIAYAENKEAGAWQNVVMFLGDDDGTGHMKVSNECAEIISGLHPGYHVKKVIWDAYERVASSTGFTYPDVTKIVKQQQAAGALLIDYCGHGSEISISHERVLTLSDFQNFQNTHYPLWVTASCDIMPFDGSSENIGEAALFNKNGGSMAFFGTTRTVYTNYNDPINKAFVRHVLSTPGGKPIALGEAQRLAKNEMITTRKDQTANKLQYSLLGDPALHLCLPTLTAVVDSIDGQAVADATKAELHAGSTVRVIGHVESAGERLPHYDGIAALTVRDSEELIVCRLNEGTYDKPFTYYDRPNVLFSGTDSVHGGRFDFTFAVPMDIRYAEGTGLMNIYMADNSHQQIAHGAMDNFVLGGTDQLGNDSIGPSIFCYLNTPSFTNGDKVNSTPYFVAVINDRNGINASGTGIGHDLELTIDNEMTRTYVLNDNFTFDFGSYTSGSTYFNIPELSAGMHKLRFRAWDILNNPSTAELSFTVVPGLSPQLFSVACTDNPATTSTTFIVNHDRTGSSMDVELDVFDLSGRHLWEHHDMGVATDGAYTLRWDLTVDGGQRLQTGVYLYRVSVSCDGSKRTSKAKKLIVIGNN